jgi:hypothetical protein
MRWIVVVLGMMLVFPEPAYAYLDPGTGSFILQMLLAGVLAAGASVKLFWHRLKSAWVRLFSDAEPRTHDRK